MTFQELMHLIVATVLSVGHHIVRFGLTPYQNMLVEPLILGDDVLVVELLNIFERPGSP